MAVTATYTLLRVNVSGSEKVLDWQVSLSGTYTTTTGFAFTPAQLGFDQIDWIDVMIDGSGANTNGVALVLPQLTLNRLWLYGVGTASTDPFNQLVNPTLITGFQFVMRVYGVA